MFYELFYALHDRIAAFNVFRYITLRAAAAMVTGAAIPAMMLGDWVEKMQGKTPVQSAHETNGIIKPAPAVRQQDGRWIIEIPMPAPIPTQQ